MPVRISSSIAALAVLLSAGAAVAPARAQVEVPMVDLGWLVVPVYLDNEPIALRFILDTGASVTAVSARTAARFSRGSSRKIELHGASGPTMALLATVPMLRVGKLSIENHDVIVLADQDLVSDDQAFDGILGADILSRFDIMIDAPRGSLWLYPHGVAPTDTAAAGLGAALPIDLLGGGLIRHRVEVNGAAVDALLDSGARRMLINRAGSDAAGIEVHDSTAQTASPGLGDDAFEFHSGSLGALVVAGTSFAGLRTLVGDLPIFGALGMQARPMLIIGAPLLSRCPVFIAYSAHTIRYCRQPIPPAN
jgi:predicted aspartyl protease